MGSCIIGTKVGTLSTTDDDTDDFHTYSLVSGDGDTDNGSFTISGDTLKTNEVFDYESKFSYSIRVQTEDSGGEVYSKSFTIDIINDVETEIDDFSKKITVQMYPNPVTDKLIIELTHSLPLKMIIFDSTGNTISKETLEGKTNEIDLNHVVSGLYLVKLFNGNEIIHQQKIVKY